MVHQAVRIAKQIGLHRAHHTDSACRNSPQCLASGRLQIPIFMVSSVTGSGLHLLHAFLHALPTPQQMSQASFNQPQQDGACSSSSTASSSDGSIIDGVLVPDDEPTADNVKLVQSKNACIAHSQATHFQVEHTYEVKGVGCVVSGTVVSGTVALGQTLQLGPQGQGGFTAVEVTCIQRSQVITQPHAFWPHCNFCSIVCHIPLAHVSSPVDTVDR